MRIGRKFLLVLVVAVAFSAGAGAQKLVIWDYVPWRVTYYQQYADQYMKEHPGVEIEVQLVNMGEYISKIIVSAVTGTPPAAFAAHPVWITSLTGMIEPFPHDLFPPEELAATHLGYEQLILEDGNAYYFPLGMQGPMLFINLDHWEQAGLGDPPATWEEAVNIGRRTTRVAEGVTQLAGFYFYDDMMGELFLDLIYQLGGNVYRFDGRYYQVTFDEPIALQAVDMLNNWYATGVSGMGENLTFHQGHHVMRYGLAWRRQQLMTVPDLRWTVAPLPTSTGEFFHGMSKMDYYLGLAVPIGNTPEVARAAFEFIHWMYSDDERMMELNSQSGTLPSRMSLWSHPEILDNPVLRQLTQTLPYARTPGDYPQWIKDTLQAVRNAIATGSANPTTTLFDLTRQINARLVEEPVSWVAE